MADKEATSSDETTQTTDEYQGLPGRTRQEAIHYTCSGCGRLFGGAVYTAVNVGSDPELGDQLSKGELNALSCPACSASCNPAISLIYHDPKATTFALLLPEALRHLELRERARVLRSLMDDPADIPDYVRRVDVAFGTTGLLGLLDRTMEALTPRGREDDQRKIREAQDARRAELETKEEELLAREEDLQAKQEDMVSLKAKLEQAQDDLARSWRELDHEREAVRSLSLELQAREGQLVRQAEQAPAATMTAAVDEGPAAGEAEAGEAAPPEQGEREGEGDPAAPEVAEPAEHAPEGRPMLEVDRWRASDDPTRALHHEGRTYLLSKPGAEVLKILAVVEPELWIQLISGAHGPLVTLVAIPPTLGDQGAVDQSLYWFLNPADATDRALLDALAEDCSLLLDLYDDESRQVTSWEIQAPLSENVRQVLERCDALLAQVDAGARDFARAVEGYRASGDERLGRKQHNFSADSFRELPSPAAVRLALGIVAYWSERENEAYLVEVKSFPLTYWRRIRERVVRKALEYGLHLSAELTAFALEQQLAGSLPDLLRASVANFAEVCRRVKPSDLDPAQELENWKLLLAACVKEGVPVEAEIEVLAAATAQRAGVEVDETAPGGDIGLLTDEQLLELLTDRAHSRDVALELCERGDVKHAEAIYRAVCNMTRNEVARVIPSMMHLGAETIPLFSKGLRHRKSFIRQGCALALGSMKAESGIAQLMEMLLGEPTNVWKEASRALGDMGPLALGALVAGVKTADGEGRERIAWALSQAALNEACLGEVEAMSKGKDARLARVAGRAIQLTGQVRSFNQEVRGGRPLADQTIVRSFSRQFFESMSGEVSELDEEDILEQEEVLDDSDILDEEVEVSDDDIL